MRAGVNILNDKASCEVATVVVPGMKRSRSCRECSSWVSSAELRPGHRSLLDSGVGMNHLQTHRSRTVERQV